MIRGKKKHMIIFLIILALILIALVYYFPLQRILAEKKYEQYATQQGVLAADIKNKNIYKDYKQGGYFISVKYHSDPNHRYRYHYYLVDSRKSGTLLNTMYCDIFDTENNLLDDYTNVLYKPIK